METFCCPVADKTTVKVRVIETSLNADDVIMLYPLQCAITIFFIMICNWKRCVFCGPKFKYTIIEYR